MLAGVRLADVGNDDILLQRRSFFGVYRVRRMSEYHVLQHGTTTHGGQSRDRSRRLEPLTYYHREGPMGQIFASIAVDRPLRLALGGGAMLAGVRLADVGNDDILLQQRSFFGVYRVRRMSEYHVLQHGTTTHGGQSRDPNRRLEPLTYYHRDGPMGQIFESIAADRPLRPKKCG